MFPFLGNACWGTEPISRTTYQERKLKLFKWMRDNLETKLTRLSANLTEMKQQNKTQSFC